MKTQLEERLSVLEVGEEEERDRHRIPVWKLLAALVGLVMLMLVSAIAVCYGNDQCARTQVPSVHNLLNSTFATPFVITGINFAIKLHFITAMTLYYRAQSSSPYYAVLQVVAAVCMYVSIGVTLYVFPLIHDWTRDWAGIAVILFMTLWMGLAYLGMRRFYRWRIVIDKKHRFVRRYSFALFLLYVACGITHVVLIVVGALPPQQLEIGLFVTELVGGLAILGFLATCIVHIWEMKIVLI